jgi:hypothetical protein
LKMLFNLFPQSYLSPSLLINIILNLSFVSALISEFHYHIILIFAFIVTVSIIIIIIIFVVSDPDRLLGYLNKFYSLSSTWII